MGNLNIFEEETKLNEALNDGTCYQIHEYILHNLYGFKDFQNMNFTMDFEYGRTPNLQEDSEKLFSKFTKKLIRTLDIKLVESKDVCNICNHDFDKHQLRGEINEEIGYPTKGWMICPEENCKCFRTWSHQTEN
ncbi:MAG: hypothetical protein R3E32_23075 [Chitinophagales bacterium]